ncbi:MAG: (4Fe-4S)-binding protein [Gloeobacteraceae cyanobacterium ES-bin-316]|nr:(4Fe-4S)-binding protein [Ferruginibacter sp.]
MKDITKKYSNGEVTIVWRPAHCIHSKICWDAATGLPQVFNPRERPWIKPEAASTEQIIAQVKKCPSAALSYYLDAEEIENKNLTVESIVEVLPAGPLLVYGNLTIKDKDGKESRTNKVTAFCRCGASQNKPYCDGTHTKINFKD